MPVLSLFIEREHQACRLNPVFSVMQPGTRQAGKVHSPLVVVEEVTTIAPQGQPLEQVFPSNDLLAILNLHCTAVMFCVLVWAESLFFKIRHTRRWLVTASQMLGIVEDPALSGL